MGNRLREGKSSHLATIAATQANSALPSSVVGAVSIDGHGHTQGRKTINLSVVVVVGDVDDGGGASLIGL